MAHVSLRRLGSVGCALGCLMIAGSAFGQTKPFPHGGGAPNGFIPTTVSSDDAQASYDSWKQNYLKTDCGNGQVRVEFNSPTGTTVSEGMGYGMVLTAYFGDKTNFDGLWKFAQAHFNSNKLMGWHESCSAFTTNDGGSGSATDGDTDIGFALVVAADQWGATYKQAATTYLQALKAHDYTTCSKSGRNMATNGDWDTGCTASNSSYWMPGYLRVFHEFTGDAFWGKAADDAVALWQLNANSKTGLIANEVNEDGTVGDSESYVDYNGCRVPWRAITDYLWYGTAGSKAVTNKITGWANSVGISKLVDGYNTDGSATGQYTEQNPWVGGWATGTMSDTQALANSFSSNFKSIDNDEGGYYGASLRSLYLLTLTGNFWKPGTASTGTTTGDAGASSGSTSGSSSGSSGSSGSSSGSTASGSSSGSDVGMQSAASMTDDGGAPGASSGSSGNGASSDSNGGSSSSGGCSVGGKRTAGGAGAAVVALLGLAWVGRRRRRAS